MPTSNSSDEEVEVYKNIDKIIKNVKGVENLLVMGDWNAVVGEEKVIKFYEIINHFIEMFVPKCRVFNLIIKIPLGAIQNYEELST